MLLLKKRIFIGFCEGNAYRVLQASDVKNLESKNVKFFEHICNCINNQLEDKLEINLSKYSELSSPDEAEGRLRGCRLGEKLAFADEHTNTTFHEGSVMSKNVPDVLIAQK